MSARNLLSLSLIALLYTGSSFAQTSATLRQEQPPIPVEEIIKKFSEKERDFRIARGNYTYRQDVTMQELNANDRVLGEYHVVSDILFDSSGKRTEKIIYAPATTLGTLTTAPIGSRPRRVRRTNASLTMQTGVLVDRSRSLNGRPFRKEMPSVSKYPTLTI